MITVYESYPIGVVFKDKVKYILDSSSKLIPFNEVKFDKKFPSIFGKNAENNFVIFFNELKNNKFPINEVKNYYYFQIDRWDLQLLNNKVIKLPHNNTENAIIKSIELLEHKNFKSYNIIDLRIDVKIIVR